MNLPIELRSPKKGVINIKNKDQKCFLWCHIRDILQKNIQKELEKLIKNFLSILPTNPEEITQKDKEFISNLDYDGIEFPMQEKDFSKIKPKNNICINVFGMKMS